MVRLRSGPVTDHIKASNGPDANIYRFYHTRYSNEYGKEGFNPRPGRPIGTGYSSNFRPQLYYSRSLDNLDNPLMGFMMTDNYETVTKQSFRTSRDSDGRSALPRIVYDKHESGFIRQRPLTVPVSTEIGKSFYDMRKYGGYSLPGIEKKHKAILHTLKRHDPIEKENYHLGPQYMASETKVKFKGESTAPLNIHLKDVSRLEDGGFTHNINIEPITFKPDDCFDGEPGMYESIPMGATVMKTDYSGWHDSGGNDPLTTISKGSSHETGFIRQKSRHLYTHRIPSKAYLSANDAPGLVRDRIRKNDPSEFTNLVYPHNKKTMTKAIFQGKQRQDLTEEELLNRQNVGQQEFSGHSLNNKHYLETQDRDPTRYLTNYNMRHYEMEPQGVDREGWVMGGLQSPREDGYRRDFKVHSHGRLTDESDRLKRLAPYVERSMKRIDRFVHDHTHDHKISKAIPTNALSTATLHT